MEDKRLLRLVKRARRGDNQAFSELISMKSRKIVYIATKLMGNKADGEDAAQEAVLMLARKIGSLKKPELFDAWMYRIVYNICMDEKRRLSKDINQSAELETAIATVPEKSSEVLPESNYDETTQRTAIMNAIDQLSERYRTILIMFYYDDMSYTEIAGRLQVNEQVVANTLNRARAKLREVLEGAKAGEVPDDVLAGEDGFEDAQDSVLAGENGYEDGIAARYDQDGSDDALAPEDLSSKVSVAG